MYNDTWYNHLFSLLLFNSINHYLVFIIIAITYYEIIVSKI